MPYQKQTWADGPTGSTPLDADSLNHIENGIASVESALTSALAAKADVNAMTTALAAKADSAAVSAVAANQAYRTIASFGAVGDGIVDDSDAVSAALASSLPIDWGGRDRTYRITRPISITLQKDAAWKCAGATLRLESAAPIGRFVDINTNGYSLSMLGAWIVNANRKAFQGVVFSNNTDTLSVLRVEHLIVTDVFRGSTTIGGVATAGGDGIYVQGNYDSIEFIRPIVRRVTMVTAAHQAGVQGVTGMTVKSSSTTRYWRRLNIDGPLIEDVFCEVDGQPGVPSATDIGDQDGIRIMAAENVLTTTLIPYEEHFWITRATFRNCMGRSLKSQAEFGWLNGAMIVRNKQRGSGTRGGVEIDFQVGGGMVRDVQCKYTNDAPVTVVQLTGPDDGPNKTPTPTTEKIVPHPSVSGVRVAIEGSVAPQCIVAKSFRSEASTVSLIADIESVGTQPDTMVVLNGIAGGIHKVTLRDIVGAPTLANGMTGFITPRIDAWGLGSKIYARGLVNRGSTISLASSPYANVNPTVEWSIEDCEGFQVQKALDAARNVVGPVKRVDAIGPTGVIRSGVWRPASSGLLADGATWKLPASFLTNYTGRISVSVDGDIQGQADFAVNQSQVIQLTSGGTSFAVGTTSDPGTTGKVTVWTSSTGPSIANHTGVAHTITVTMLG